MIDVIIYLCAAAAGYAIGLLLKKKKITISWTAALQSICLYVLILVMGMRMGSNREVIDNIGNIGFSALLFTIMAQAGTVGFMFFTRRLLGFNRFGKLESIDVSEENNAKGDGKTGLNKTTLFVVAAVIIGLLFGFFIILRFTEENIIFNGDISGFNELASAIIRIGLIILLVFVGLDLSKEGNVFSEIKSAGLRILAFPFAAMLGSLAGALISGQILGMNTNEALAVGSGFGWYTLAPGIIMDAGYVQTSAIAFLHNVTRELAAIVLIPTVANKVGYIECCGMGGAAAMDVTLPVAEKATNPSIAIYSFVLGVVLTIMVPILVPIMLAL